MAIDTSKNIAKVTYNGVEIPLKSAGGGMSTSKSWLLNSTVNPSYFDADKAFIVEFTSNNTSYNSLRLGRAANIILYDNTIVCSGGIMQEAYRTVTFLTPPTGDLLTWLQANATPVGLEPATFTIKSSASGRYSANIGYLAPDGSIKTVNSGGQGFTTPYVLNTVLNGLIAISGASWSISNWEQTLDGGTYLRNGTVYYFVPTSPTASVTIA